MRLILALSGLLATASTALASTSSHAHSHSSLLQDNSLVKRTGNHNGGGYSYCADSRDKLVFKNGQCACKSNPSSSWSVCQQPKTTDRGKAVCNDYGCSLLCGENMVVKSGDCKCKEGYQFGTGSSSNKCIPSCRQYEAFDSRSNTCVCAPSCSRNKRNNNQCEPSCGTNEEYKNGQCTCKSGYEFGTTGNNSKKCVLKCKQYEQYDERSKTCVCAPSCSRNSRNNNQCEPSCGDNEEYKNGQCKCKSGFEKKNGKCKPICTGDNEEYKNGACKCKDGFKKNQQGKCKPDIPQCGNNMEWNGHKCVCKPGCSPNHGGNSCNPPQCRSNEEYKPDLKRCVCKPGYERTVWGFCVPSHPECPKKNEYWDGEKCVCKPGCWRNRNDDCEPNQPSHRPNPGEIQKKHWSQKKDLPVWSKKHHTREQDSHFCPDSLSACPIPSLQGGYECVDTTQELENCGGCSIDGDGVDCTAIRGVSGVGCLSGKCVVFSCAEGFRLSSAGACVASLIGSINKL